MWSLCLERMVLVNPTGSISKSNNCFFFYFHFIFLFFLGGLSRLKRNWHELIMILQTNANGVN